MNFFVIPEENLEKLDLKITDDHLIYIKLVGVGPKTIEKCDGDINKILTSIVQCKGHVMGGPSIKEQAQEKLIKMIDDFLEKKFNGK